MTSMELLDIIGNVDDRYVLEIYDDLSLRKKHIPVKRALLIAALITLLLILVGCVAVIMKLQGVKIGRYTNTYPFVNGITKEFTSDVISLQGFVGSVNYQAAKEWIEFEKSYDPDGKLLESSSKDDYQAPSQYMEYNCYTREMQEKVDEICDKYHLELLGPIHIEEYEENLFDALGIDGIIADDRNAKVILNAEYYYQDGSFSLSGVTTLNEGKMWPHQIDYQYRCVMKTSFDGVALTIGDMESYEQWNYTLKDGTQVLLALSENKALLIVDKAEYFVTVNVLNPSYTNVFYEKEQIRKKDLEVFADTFTFDFVPQRPDPAGVSTFE